MKPLTISSVFMWGFYQYLIQSEAVMLFFLKNALRACLMLLILVTAVVPAKGQESKPSNDLEDIDVFMAKVLERRDVNWDQLYDYIFNERETMEIKGDIDIPAIQSFINEWRWFVRDGYLVRSPLSSNGVNIPEKERTEYEDNWIKESKERKKEGKTADREQFFGFEFKPGNYFYAGKTTIDGRDLAIIEYYPDIKITNATAKDDEDKYDDMVEKAMMVTLYVYPQEYQLVQMTIHNGGFDFLPGRWLVRVTGIEATMKMGKPLGDVWMPIEIDGKAKLAMANGDVSFRYRREYYDYSKAKVRVQFRFAPRSAEKDEQNDDK